MRCPEVVKSDIPLYLYMPILSTYGPLRHGGYADLGMPRRFMQKYKVQSAAYKFKNIE